jgi:hypothetical protein
MRSEILNIIFAWFWGESYPAGISMASRRDETGLLEKKYPVKCNSVSDEMVTGKGSLVIVASSKQGVYIVTVAVVAVMVAVVVAAAADAAATAVRLKLVEAVVAGVVVVAVVVAAVVAPGVVESRLIAVVVPAEVATAVGLITAAVVVKGASQSIASLRTAAMSLIDVKCMSVVSFS